MGCAFRWLLNFLRRPLAELFMFYFRSATRDQWNKTKLWILKDSKEKLRRFQSIRLNRLYRQYIVACNSVISFTRIKTENLWKRSLKYPPKGSRASGKRVVSTNDRMNDVNGLELDCRLENSFGATPTTAYMTNSGAGNNRQTRICEFQHGKI